MISFKLEKLTFRHSIYSFHFQEINKLLYKTRKELLTTNNISTKKRIIFFISNLTLTQMGMNFNLLPSSILTLTQMGMNSNLFLGTNGNEL